MKKNIDLLIVSHSFLKKINTDIYEFLSKKYNLNILFLTTNKIYEKKLILPDYDFNEIKNLIVSKTIFNHLRLKIYLKIFAIIKKRKINNILLDIDFVSLQSFIILILSIFYKFKVYYYSNENNLISNKSYKKKIILFFYKFFLFFFNSKFHKIFCYTKQISQNLLYAGIEKSKLQVIPLGFNNKVFYRNNNSPKNANIFVISYFGRINHTKGLDILLKALINLDIDRWIFQLDLHQIDDLKYFNSIKKDLKILKKKNKLKIIKPDYYNIGDYMRKTHITIVPSNWNEQYGRVIQEATACGSIVLGSNNGAIPEIINNNEFIFNINDEDDLTIKIKSIINNYKQYYKNYQTVYDNITNKRSLNNQSKILYETLFNNL